MVYLIDTVKFSLPEGWVGHPDNQNTADKKFAINTQSGSVFLTVSSVDSAQAMPYGQDQTIIETLHQRSVDDDSGLIEVATIGNGETNSVYSIFKRRVNNPDNPMLKVFYSASLYLHVPNGKAYAFQFQAREEGMTGMRDAQILAQAQSRGEVTLETDPLTGSPKMSGWQQDPYDPSFTKGFLMNQSEKVEYDALFPQHPLSLLRVAIGEVSGTAKEE